MPGAMQPRFAAVAAKGEEERVHFVARSVRGGLFRRRRDARARRSRRWSRGCSPTGSAGVAPFIAGYVVGDMIWLVVAGTGLAALANAFAGAFTAIKYAGAAYLLYLAWRTATAPATRRRGAAAGLARACAPSSARCR